MTNNLIFFHSRISIVLYTSNTYVVLTCKTIELFELGIIYPYIRIIVITRLLSVDCCFSMYSTVLLHNKFFEPNCMESETVKRTTIFSGHL